MKNITKYDIADIAVVCIALQFVIRFLNAAMRPIYMIFTSEDLYRFSASKGVSIALDFLHVFAALACFWFLLFKRHLLLDRLFSNAKQTEVSIPKEAESLTDYSFWIRLIGIYIAFSSGVTFISRLSWDIGKRSAYTGFPFDWERSGPHLVSAIIAIVVIWQSSNIAYFLDRKRKN